MIQFITSGTDGKDQKVTLWRTGEYTYLMEIGKNKIPFYDTEYYGALEEFDNVCKNYTEA